MAEYTLADGTLNIRAGLYLATIRAAEIERNWDALTHYPDRRAAIALHELTDRLQSFADFLDGIVAAGGAIETEVEAERFARRHVELTRDWWSAESRCMSWFIVGPANFPTDRNRKRQDSADRRYQETTDHIAAARKAVERQAFPHGMPGGAIRGSNPDAPDLLRREIEARERRQEAMKAANAAIRATKSADPEAAVQAIVDTTGWSHAVARKVAAPDVMGIRGFASFSLTNNNAEIKRLKIRLANIEAKRERGTVERSHNTSVGAVEVVENAEADRIQIVFPGKPDDATRSLLKSNGFRWAPSNGAWQRHLNNAGRYAAQRVIGALQREAA